ncbi:hypothetical protein FVEN_g12116 [Fusarium venenatum]|nr:hypothetical protein FVEN_g12116 [Fusarium venenatum]
MDIIGRNKIQPSRKQSYQVAIAIAYKSRPTEIVDSTTVLNKTSLVDEAVWLSNFNADYIFEKMEVVTEKYGIILMTICVIIPIAFSMLEYFPLSQPFVSRFRATFVDPPLFGKNHAVPAPFSILPIRRRLYDAFLASHVILSLLAMIGCILHMFYRYEWQWGYQTWVWIAFVFWIFDRFLARPLRLMRNGVQQAQITLIDDDYLQVTVSRIRVKGHVYVYFPSLTWRVWENHPFLVAAYSSGRRLQPGVELRNGNNDGNEAKQD